MDLTRYNCFVGTARGFLLSTTDKPKQIKNVKPEFSSEVTALSFDSEQKEILVGYQNGNLHRYDPLSNTYLDTICDLEGKGGIIGLGCMENVIIAGKSDGIINIWKKKKRKHFNINLDSEGTLNSMVLNESKNSIGTGGEKNDFKLWDIETQQCVFKAKSMGHDKLNLPIPTSIKGIAFFPGDPYLSCCCTKEGHVLVYDDRKQRRPVTTFFETKASYTTIAPAYRERQCLVGTTRGYMQLLDMKIGKCLKTFTTFTGSVTSIACDPLEPYVFSTSLDRHLRVHHLETKALIDKIYLKVNLTSLLVRPVVKEEQTDDEKSSDKLIKDVDVEYENIFDDMEVVVDGIKKKKNKRIIEEVNDTQLTVKKSKKKDTNDDTQLSVKKSKTTDKNNDTTDRIKVKKKKTIVKNIFAK